MIAFEVNVVISRPTEEVFRFVADGRNAPRWNSAVQEVKLVSEGPVALDTEYWMARELPRGRVENTYRIVEYEPNERLSIKTTSGPTPFLYRYTFDPVGSGTRLSLKAEASLEGVPRLLSPVASRVVKRGVEANFETLKTLLESSD